jgi:N-acetylmuramoyl-L-alanine amidase CwlA
VPAKNNTESYNNKVEEKVTKNEIAEDIKKPIYIKINKPICEYSHGKKFKNRPEWIVVHYTACINTSARTMCSAMKNNTAASSHFYIDEKDICSAVPEEYIAWHVGTGECKQPEAYRKMPLKEIANYKTNDWRYDLAAKNHLKWQSENDDFKGNGCSIGVDICVHKKSSSSKKATDKDWYFTNDAVDNTAKTVAYLVIKYNIHIDHIIRHSDATGKLCPQPFAWPPEIGDNRWEEFKNLVIHYVSVGVNASFI